MTLKVFIYLFSLLAPRRLRTDWREEWLGELDEARRVRGAARALRFALGAPLDALSSRWTTRSQPRSRRPGPWFFTADVRFALRNILRRPGYSLVVVATLAIGIGANTAVFSLVDSVLLKPMPYKDPERLAFLWSKLAWDGVPRAWVSGPHAHLLRQEAATLDGLVAIRTRYAQLTGSGEPQLVRMGVATANLFDVLGVRPAIGRGFAPADRGARVIVLNHGLWQRAFGGDPAIVGRVVELAAEKYEVIGVMARDFRFVVHASLDEPARAELWTVGDWDLSVMDPTGFGFAALVRAREGQTPDAVQAELDVIAERIDKERFQDRGFGWHVAPLREDLVGAARPGLLMLLAAAGGILLIVCANVAGLGLVEASRRGREIAVRGALGAGRWRIVRGLISESLLLAAAGGAAGLGLAGVALWAVSALGVAGLPRFDEVSIDWRVLAFTLVVSLAAGLAAGLFPALRASKHDLAGSLRDGGRGATTQSTEARAMLITAEIALAVVLLSTAGVLLRSFSAIMRVDPGFAVHQVLTAKIDLPFARYPEARAAGQLHEQIAARLRAQPGVLAAGASTTLPLGGFTTQNKARPTSWSGRGDQRPVMIDLVRSTPGYFEAIGIRLKGGRDFTWNDTAHAPRVAVIDESLARRLWPNEDPIGREMAVAGVRCRIAGVVGHARLYRMDEDGRPQVYLPWTQNPTLGLTLAIRTSGDPAALAAAVRETVWSLDPKQPVAEVATMAEHVAVSMAGRRLQLALLTVFAGCAVLLASVGLYGVMSSSVAQRKQEIAIRAALGATAFDLRWMVMGSALRVAGLGIGAGLAGALAIGGPLARFTAGVTARDPVALTATAILLAAVAVAAAYVPARRAATVDPFIALRDVS